MLYNSRLWRRISHETVDIITDMKMAMRNPHRESSMPFMRFIPKNDDISVGSIMMIDTDVSVRIAVFMLLLMMDE